MDQKDGIWMNHFILDGRYEDLLSHYKFNGFVRYFIEDATLGQVTI